MASKAKTAHSKFDKFNKQEVITKDKYKVTGDVCTGYKVMELDGGEIVFSSAYMWDAIDECRRLNAPK